MFVTELTTFVQKFQQLWSAGITAHLDLDTSNENAEEANLVEETDKCENDRSECSDNLDTNEKTLTDAAEEASDKDMNVADELCPDEEFDNAIPTE